jgi:outer membrane biosynthesis protein TonB
MATLAGARRSPVGLIGSALLHVGIIGATLFTFAHRLDITEESPPVVPVDLVTLADKTNIVPTVKVRPKIEPRQDEQPTPPEPQKTETAPEPAPQPEKMDAPPEEAVAPEPVKTPPPPPKAKPKPESNAEAEPKKEKFDIDKVMALIDKRTPAEKSAPNARVGERTVKGFGAQNAMTADLQDALRSQIQQCWSPPVGGPHPEELVVDFDLLLNQDGSVAQPPQLVGNSASAVNSNPYTRAAAEAARRAIYECAPYKLPADRYALWREINPFHFDPRQMMGQ